ncbi:MAG: hypothetical protein KAR81_00740 [Sulfurimonas sp.]|nr:hypothetical protein [Sulfurimonas sp.]
MLYILTALKPEAQAFVDKYKLNKSECENFTVFTGNNIKVIVSGLGVDNAKLATTAIIKKFKPEDDDIFLNIGICGASKEYEIGQFLEIGSIIYNDNKYIINSNFPNIITCKDSEVYEDNGNIVDMESFGFYSATKDIKNRHMYKVVSDHFEPSKVTKDKTKSLIFNVIEEVMKKVKV